MYLTQKNHIRCDKKTYRILRILTRLSKNLYNYTLYTVRQYYFNNGEFLPYEKAYHLVKHNENYQLLPSRVAQQTMKVVERNMRSFFRVLKERKKGNYNRPARPPRYLPKNGHFVCIFPKDMFKVIGDKIRLSLGRNFEKEFGVRFLEFGLPSHVVGKRIKEVMILPRCRGLWFEIEYVYESEPEKVNLDYSKCLSIDLGLDNFATCISTSGTPFIIEGRGLKSFNRWWNKEKAKLQSVYSKQGIKMGRKMAWLLRKRKNVVNNFMNQAANYIIKFCLSNKIGNIVIGELKEIKNGMNLGYINNQNFQYISYGLFKQKLKAKCEFYGINYIEVDEAYTSQTCSACGDVNRNNRKHRGLYVCKKCGNVMNADVNGALNILKKVAGESAVRRILSSDRIRPWRVSPTHFVEIIQASGAWLERSGFVACKLPAKCRQFGHEIPPNSTKRISGNALIFLKNLARPGGLEPPTFGFVETRLT